MTQIGVMRDYGNEKIFWHFKMNTLLSVEDIGDVIMILVIMIKITRNDDDDYSNNAKKWTNILRVIITI